MSDLNANNAEAAAEDKRSMKTIEENSSSLDLHLDISLPAIVTSPDR